VTGHIERGIVNPATVRNNPDRSRFELCVDGAVAGTADYQDTAGERVFVHTEIDPDYAGRGLARLLVQTALDRTREEGYGVLPMCSTVQHFVETHPDYQVMVPYWARERFGLREP
jgi:predicted GNAT family acetyltransferase